MLIYGADEYVSQWVQSHFPGHRGFGPSVSVGIADGQKLVAGLVWHDYRPQYGSLQMSIYAEPKTRWCSREVLKAFFHYPFVQLKCNTVYLCMRKKNKHARKFVERLGFRFSGLLRRGFGTEDMVLYDMLQNECKWGAHERQSLRSACA